MTEVVHNERDPLIPPDDRSDDDEDYRATGSSTETTEFELEPKASSTPAPCQTMMNIPDETPSWAELPKIPGSLATTTFTVESELDKEFHCTDKTRLKYKLDEKGRLEVGLLELGKNKKPKPYRCLTTEILGKKGRIPDKPKDSKRSFKSPWGKSSTLWKKK